MSNNQPIITNLTVPFQWYQQVREVKSLPAKPKRISIYFEGPMEHWEGELYSELINNPRLIAEKIFVLYPPKTPHQGTYENPNDTLTKLPPTLRRRVKFIDKDLKAHRIAGKILKPIKEDLLENRDYDNEKILTNLTRVQGLLRAIIESNRKKSICDINDGLKDLSHVLIKIDIKQLSDESRARLNVIKSYFNCYRRKMAGEMSILKPIGIERSAPTIFQELIEDAEREDIISERGKIGQIPGLTKLEIKRISRKISNYFHRNKNYIHGGIEASELVVPNISKVRRILDSMSSIGLPSSTVPIVNLSKSRYYALLNELRCGNPVFHYRDGLTSVSPNININLQNFFTLMSHPLMLDEELLLRQCEIEKKDITLDLFPEKKE